MCYLGAALKGAIGQLGFHHVQLKEIAGEQGNLRVEDRVQVLEDKSVELEKGQGDLKARSPGTAANFQNYIDKPFTNVRLLARLRQSL